MCWKDYLYIYSLYIWKGVTGLSLLLIIIIIIVIIIIIIIFFQFLIQVFWFVLLKISGFSV